MDSETILLKCVLLEIKSVARSIYNAKCSFKHKPLLTSKDTYEKPEVAGCSSAGINE